MYQTNNYPSNFNKKHRKIDIYSLNEAFITNMLESAREIFLRPIRHPLPQTANVVMVILSLATILNALPGVSYPHHALFSMAVAALSLALFLMKANSNGRPVLLGVLYAIALPVSLTLAHTKSGGASVELACLVAGMALIYTSIDWRISWLGNFVGAVIGFCFSIWFLEAGIPLWRDIFLATTLNTILGVMAFLQSNASRDRRRLAKLSIGVTAHELRTPLFAMGLLSSDLRDTSPVNSAPHNTALNMLGLIESMNVTLDLQSNNAIDSWASINQRDCDVDEMIKKAIEKTFITKSGRENIVVSSQERSIVFTNESLFVSAIQNLIMNAERAVAKKNGGESLRVGDVVITTRMNNDENVEIEVTDKGIGISASDQKMIFDDFFTTSGVPSNGLGLTMVKNTVEKMGGSVSVYSELGIGSIFKLTIPAKKL